MMRELNPDTNYITAMKKKIKYIKNGRRDQTPFQCKYFVDQLLSYSEPTEFKLISSAICKCDLSAINLI